jgi:glycosyltransferase 2 family protein
VSAHRHLKWRRVLRVLFYVFVAVVAWLLLRAARAVDWNAVGQALAGYDARTLGFALLLTAASYFIYSCYDLAARGYAGHALPTRQVLSITAVAYAFALSIGAAIGGAGFRLRMYARAGLAVGKVTRIIAFAVATNWLGYAVLAGALFASGWLVPPPAWKVSATGLQGLGVVLLAVAGAYFVACRLTHGRVFHVRGHHFRLPSLRLALMQAALAVANWALMGTLLWLLLPQVPWPLALGALLLASVATALAHIPSGIGVLEAVVVAMLGGLRPEAQVLAGVLAYRACYYLLPLLLAVLAFGYGEWRRGGKAARHA